MKKIRILALLMALCLLALQFAGCKKENDDWSVTGGPGVNEPSGTGDPSADAGTQTDQKDPLSSTPLAVIDLTAEVSYTEEWPEKEPDEAFIRGQMDFSVELFRNAAQKTQCKNTLISPLSVAMALAMTANGAEGRTAAEMLSVLGGHSTDDLNAYLGNWRLALQNDEKATLRMGNSIWIRDVAGFEAKQEFLQSNAKYYHSQVFKAPFNRIGVDKINEWVDTKTDGMIEKLVDELDPETMMVLINALAFDAVWEEPYAESQVRKDRFHSIEGKEQTAQMMYSTEEIYLEGEGAIGFLRPYAGGKYSFGALLPAEGTFEEYVGDLTGERLLAILQNKQSATVHARLPQFTNEYSLVLNRSLEEMGMPSAFQGGFGKMSNTDLRIDEVIHKTFIEVNESGTRAAAATAVVMDKYAMAGEPKTVTLDRPFIYFILDNETNLPIFLGTVTSI